MTERARIDDVPPRFPFALDRFSYRNQEQDNAWRERNGPISPPVPGDWAHVQASATPQGSASRVDPPMAKGRSMLHILIEFLLYGWRSR